ncbi:hypothetical protein JOM56_012026 [Amanita muscaria]
MKLAVGPLTTGTYVSQAVVHQGKYYGLHKDVGGTELRLIEDKEHAGIKWYLEKVGENKFKGRSAEPGSSNTTMSVNPVDKTVEVTEGESEWIIEPTDIDSEYMYGNISHLVASYSANRENGCAACAPLTIHRFMRRGPQAKRLHRSKLDQSLR